MPTAMSRFVCHTWRRTRRWSRLFPIHATGSIDGRTQDLAWLSQYRTVHRQQEAGDDGSTATDRQLKLHNTLTNRSEVLPSDSIKSKGLAWYTCGPTTYAPTHMGHARTYVWIDIARRVMESSSLSSAQSSAGASKASPPPLFVMNITDIDDKILAACNADGDDASSFQDPLQLARHFENEFWDDLEALNCLRPHVITRVSEHVDSDIVPYIQRLVDNGVAYTAKDGVYFDVRAFNEASGTVTKYGKLAPPAASQDFFDISDRELTADNANPTANSDNDGPNTKQKRDRRDFVLWKFQKEEEQLFWESPWGNGRPGWHIECSAMIEAVQSQFRDTHRFLVHAGGIDLKFPHHTNEIAQAEGYHGSGNWIPHWFHTGHLHIDGRKMSKSLKNFVTVKEFLQGESGHSTSSSKTPLDSPADDFRLWCLSLSGSYRSTATLVNDAISQARSIRYKVLQFLVDAEELIHNERRQGQQEQLDTIKWIDADVEFFQHTNHSIAEIEAALRNDLDGSAFATNLQHVVDLGRHRIAARYSAAAAAQDDGDHDGDDKQIRSENIAPLQHAVDEIRRLLRLVGFSSRTTEAGLSATANTGGHGNQTGPASTDAIDAFVDFRSSIRTIALQGLKSPPNANVDAKECFKQMLDECDKLRDDSLPSIGIQISDKQDLTSKWQYCVPPTSDIYSSIGSKETEAAGTGESQDGETQSAPLSPPSEASASATAHRQDQADGGISNTYDIAVEQLFMVGRYANQFSAYDDDGVPTHDATGAQISKRLHKKLTKKREAHIRRLDGSTRN